MLSCSPFLFWIIWLIGNEYFHYYIHLNILLLDCLLFTFLNSSLLNFIPIPNGRLTKVGTIVVWPLALGESFISHLDSPNSASRKRTASHLVGIWWALKDPYSETLGENQNDLPSFFYHNLCFSKLDINVCMRKILIHTKNTNRFHDCLTVFMILIQLFCSGVQSIYYNNHQI